MGSALCVWRVHWGDSLERHRGVDGDEARDGPDAECREARDGLPWSLLALHGLLQRGVCREPHCGVCACVGSVSDAT